MTTDFGPLPAPRKDRPDFPPGYGVSSNSAGMLPWEWVDEQLSKASNYWVCTTRPDGRPHVAPVWGLWLDGRLCFGTDDHSQKARNLRQRHDVVVHLESGDNTVIVEGTAEFIKDQALWRHVNAIYAAKYGMKAGDTPEAPLLMVTPVKVLAWTESDFPKTATRWRFAAPG